MLLAVTALPAQAAGGNGTLLFDGSFTSAHWPSKYGSCGSVLSTDRAKFALTTSCNPGGDGHYRTDWCTSASCDHGKATGDFYINGKTTCTSIPIRFTSVGPIPSSGWLQFAEAKDNEGVGAGWGFDLFTTGGKNYVGVEMYDYGGHAAWGEPYTDTVPVDTGWHTWSICTNNANDNTGKVQGLWKDGVRQTFNHGPQAGHTSLSGFPIIDDGAANWPLDINDYTGGAPVPNTIIHGSPLIATMGSNGLPPEQAGGWNSP